VHGFGEHSGRYEHVFAALNARGYSCLGIDYRGFGNAKGRRAFISSFDDYLDDVAWGLSVLRGHTDQTPFLLGHSQGGLIAAMFAMARAPQLRGLILSSPALRFAVHVPLWKRALGHLMSSFWPTFTLPAEINARDLTRNEAARRQLRDDPLAVRVATARWWTESVRAQRRLLEGLRSIQTPTLLQVAGEDRVVDARVTRYFFERLETKSKRWIEYPFVFHEVYQETVDGQAPAVEDLGDWIDDVLREQLTQD